MPATTSKPLDLGYFLLCVSSGPNVFGSINVHRSNDKTDKDIRPDRRVGRRCQTSPDNTDVGESVIAVWRSESAVIKGALTAGKDTVATRN